MPITVRDIMTTSPAFVRPTLSARDLVECFDRDGVHSYPVVAADGFLQGIVTKLDLLRLFRPDIAGLEMRGLGERTVADIMRQGVLTLHPDDAVAAAIDLMVETRLHSLPVVERRRGAAPVLVGMVSQGDVLRALATETDTPRAVG